MAIHAATASFAGEKGPVRAPLMQDEHGRNDGSRHAFYRLYAYVRPQNLAAGWSRERIVQEIVAAGVPAYHGSCSEVYLEKAFGNTGWRPDKPLPAAHDLGEDSMMFLIHPTLTPAEIEKTAATVSDVLSRTALNKAA